MSEENEPKLALVTGASRGIGAAIAGRLAAAGFKVVGTATTAEGAERVGAALAPFGGRGAVLRAEDKDAVEPLLADIGAPLVLVNNAAITRDNLILRMKPEEWGEVLEANLGALYRLCRACVKGMAKARWGRIITLSSVVAAMGNPGQSNYAASKAGAEGFSRALARELASRNITVNCVAPGFIDTDMTRALPEAQREALRERIPLGRFGGPEEVAGVVGFLASEGGGYITGETIHVNGGMHMA